jgi:regulator of sirC expression with transglutaminase-like and TPR domain
MKESEIKALVHLLDDEDTEILSHIEMQIIEMGEDIIPYLEHEWEENFNPVVQRRIEDLIHTLQFNILLDKLKTWVSDGEMDLLEGMWLIATYQYPDIEREKLKNELEQIYYETWLEFKTDIHPYDQIKILNSVIFSKLKFSANTKNFHSPGNSMINVVLDSKKGNPITLCVVYMLVAQKLKLPVYGVNLPNLFILTYSTKQLKFYINVFNRGLIFSKADIDNYISNLHLNPQNIFYEPCNNFEIITRVMRNLIIAFEKLDDHYKSDEIKILLNAITKIEKEKD